MKIWQIALSDLRHRKMRSFLVMLGLAIGIASLAAISSLLESMKTDLANQMADYGPNIIITADSGEITLSYGGITLSGMKVGMKPLTPQNAVDLMNVEGKEKIRVVLPKLLGQATSKGLPIIVSGSDIPLEFSIKPWLRTVDFAAKIKRMKQRNPDPAAMSGDKLDLKREEQANIQLTKDEVILGADVSYQLGLFPTNRILINDQEYVVKSILDKNGSAEDGQVLMNLPEAQQLLGITDQLTAIELSADFSGGSEGELLEQIRAVLPDAKVTSLQKSLSDRNEVMSRLSYFGYSVSVLILAGGMLAATFGMTLSVAERTREIGVFQSIGLGKTFVRKLILLEGILLSLVGGFLGFLLGTGMAWFAIPFLSKSVATIPLRLDILLTSLVLALVIGIFASIYPASRAANLDPVEALRAL